MQAGSAEIARLQLSLDTTQSHRPVRSAPDGPRALEDTIAEEPDPHRAIESTLPERPIQAPAQSPPPLHGKRIGRFLIGDLIGSGAVSYVFRAQDELEPREVAVKVIRWSEASPHVERLKREARATWHIDHPNVVKSFASGIVPNRYAFLVLELLDGPTLQQLMAREGPFAPDRAAHIARQIARGLEGIHGCGYVHRDLKPGNIVVLDGLVERVKIIDFGLAGIPSLGHRERILTPADKIMGTPAYIAPEQVESPFVGPSADLYALGVIMYHMLSGHLPFAGSLMEIAAQHLVSEPDQLPYHGGLGPITHWLLSKTPDRRPASATEVIAELDRFMEAHVH